MNNADSFAMFFDEAWKKQAKDKNNTELDQNEKLNIALSEINEHPFLKNFPSQAREVAVFRIRLLNLT